MIGRSGMIAAAGTLVAACSLMVPENLSGQPLPPTVDSGADVSSDQPDGGVSAATDASTIDVVQVDVVQEEGPQLFPNPGFENVEGSTLCGTTWYEDDSRLTTTTIHHSGVLGCRVCASGNTPAYSVDYKPATSLPAGSYAISGYFKNGEPPMDEFWVGIEYTTGNGQYPHLSGPKLAPSSDWTRIEGTLTVQPGWQVTRVYLAGRSATMNGCFFVDDAALRIR